MAKLGQMAGGAPGAAMAGPQPVNLGGLAQMGGGPQAPGFLAGLFGPQGSQPRYDALMGLLQNAQQAAAGSNSPLLSFLTPIASAMIGTRATKDRNAVKAREASAMTESLLGPSGMSPAAQNAISVLQNPDAPDYLKAIAKTQFDAIAAPPKRGAGRPAPMDPGAAAQAAATLLGGGADPAKLNAAATVLQDPHAPSWLKEIAKSQVAPGKPAADGAGKLLPLENTFEDPIGSGNWYYLDMNGTRRRTQRGTAADDTSTLGGSVDQDGYQIQELP